MAEQALVESKTQFIDLAADIVSAYVSNNTVAASELGNLIDNVHKALAAIASGTVEEKAAAPLVPAVPVKKSITPDYIICLEDGRQFKSLKRHLRTAYDMTPEQYRAKWNLPTTYPMVAPNYAEARSNLAKTMGLGQQRKKVAEAKAAAAAPKRGRRKVAEAAE